ncbi:MAG: LysR substrate-binding domain-containing protein, partial [Pseudomonadota bacterium]
ELRHLRYFVAVAEEMNIHRAAKRLNISQPPLSVTIQQLEEELGVDLFLREGRAIQITRAGEEFLIEARKILSRVEKTSSYVRNIHEGKAGTIKIGFISSSITGILQTLVLAHRNKYPNVKIEMEQSISNRISDGLLENEFDIGIERIPVTLPAGLIAHDMPPESWSVAINQNHPFAKRKQVRISDLKDQDLIFYPRWNGPDGYDDVMSMFREYGVEPNIVQEAPEQMTIAGLVASGIGIGVVPECMAKIKVANVTHRKLQCTKGRTGFTLITRENKDLLVNQFINLAMKTKID